MSISYKKCIACSAPIGNEKYQINSYCKKHEKEIGDIQFTVKLSVTEIELINNLLKNMARGLSFNRATMDMPRVQNNEETILLSRVINKKLT